MRNCPWKSLAIGLGAAFLATTVLSGCGYGKADYPYQVGTGRTGGNQTVWAPSSEDVMKNRKTVFGEGGVNIFGGDMRGSGETITPTLSYRHDGPLWHAEFGAAYSRATGKTENGRNPGLFWNQRAILQNVTVGFDDIFYLRPRQISVTDPATGADVSPWTLSNYFLNTADLNSRDALDLREGAADPLGDGLRGGVRLGLGAVGGRDAGERRVPDGGGQVGRGGSGDLRAQGSGVGGPDDRPLRVHVPAPRLDPGHLPGRREHGPQPHQVLPEPQHQGILRLAVRSGRGRPRRR